MGYRPWGHSESDTTEQLSLSLHFFSLFKNLNDLESQHKAIELMSKRI